MGPRVGLDGRKISSPPGFDSGPSNPQPVAIPTEIPDPRSGPEGSRKLRFLDLMTTQDGDKVVSLTHQPPLPAGNTPGTRFCQRLSRPQAHSVIGRNCLDIIIPGIRMLSGRFIYLQRYNFPWTEDSWRRGTDPVGLWKFQIKFYLFKTIK